MAGKNDRLAATRTDLGVQNIIRTIKAGTPSVGTKPEPTVPQADTDKSKWAR